MGNVCTCCNWRRGAPSSSTGKHKKLDNKDQWFEQDSVPLMSARHGLDDTGFDEADGSLKRTVLIRSPRPTRTTTSDMEELSSRTSRRLQQQYEQEERDHIHRVKSSSVDSSRYSHHSANRGDDEERPRSYSENRHRRSHHGYTEIRPRHERRTVRSSSLEVQDSIREMQPSSPSARSPRITSQSQDAASFADDEVENVDTVHGSPRSHRSSSNTSSPKASSRSGSPNKKPRYGRKHYRANASRRLRSSTLSRGVLADGGSI